MLAASPIRTVAIVFFVGVAAVTFIRGVPLLATAMMSLANGSVRADHCVKTVSIRIDTIEVLVRRVR